MPIFSFRTLLNQYKKQEEESRYEIPTEKIYVLDTKKNVIELEVKSDVEDDSQE